MMSARNKAVIAEAAAVAGPLIVLSVARLFLGSAPVVSSADPGASAPAPVVETAARPFTAEQERAAAWLKGLIAASPTASPMDHPVVLARVQKDQDPTPQPQPQADPGPAIAPAGDPLAGLRLTAVLGNSTGGLAAINGRIYKVGDRIRGLSVTAIDIKNNAVEFETADGTPLRLKREHQ